MTRSNGDVFHVTGHLWEDANGHRWIPLTKASDAELWCFYICALTKCLANNRDRGDLRRHCTHHDVTVMCYGFSCGLGHQRTYDCIHSGLLYHIRLAKNLLALCKQNIIKLSSHMEIDYIYIYIYINIQTTATRNTGYSFGCPILEQLFSGHSSVPKLWVV